MLAMGEGFSWDTQDKARDIRAAEAAWAKALEWIEASRGDTPKFDMLLLDELNIPYAMIIWMWRKSLRRSKPNPKPAYHYYRTKCEGGAD